MSNPKFDYLKRTIRLFFTKRILLRIITKPYLVPSYAWKYIKPVFFDVKFKTDSSDYLLDITNNSIAALSTLSSKQEKLVPASVNDWSSSFSDTDTLESARLAALFELYGSDKSTTHNYHLIYYDILRDKVNSNINILEIGLGTNNLDVRSNMGAFGKPGASLRAFRDFCPAALVFGADIDRRVLFNEERISTFYVDQTLPESLESLKQQLNTKFDLIIDDGLHNSWANLNTLNFALDLIKEDGFFVIEDINIKDINYYQILLGLLKDQFVLRFIETRAGHVCVMNKKN